MKRDNNWRIVEPREPAVSICPYCGLAKPYRSNVESLIPCIGCKKVYMCDPPARKNWKLFSEYEKDLEAEELREDRRGTNPNSLANLKKSPKRKGKNREISKKK